MTSTQQTSEHNCRICTYTPFHRQRQKSKRFGENRGKNMYCRRAVCFLKRQKPSASQRKPAQPAPANPARPSYSLSSPSYTLSSLSYSLASLSYSLSRPITRQELHKRQDFIKHTTRVSNTQQELHLKYILYHNFSY